MNPLFIAHLTADFLLQPTWLVKWKLRSWRGIVFHALAHFIVMLILGIPFTSKYLALILIIATGHGVIDRIKIAYQKKSGQHFLLDQLAHLVLIVATSLAIPAWPSWHSKHLQGILIFLVFYSFAIAWFNLVHNSKESVRQGASVILVFASYLTAAWLMPSLTGSCSAL